MSDRAGMLREFDEARALLLAAVEGIPDGGFARPLAAGRWTVEDVLGHIAAWDKVATAAVRDLAAGAAPSMREIENVDAWNEAAVAPLRGRPAGETVAALEEARAVFREAVEDAPAELWAEAPRTGGGGEVRNLPGIVAAWTRHDRAHAAELRAFRDRAAGAGPQAS